MKLNNFKKLGKKKILQVKISIIGVNSQLLIFYYNSFVAIFVILLSIMGRRISCYVWKYNLSYIICCVIKGQIFDCFFLRTNKIEYLLLSGISFYVILLLYTWNFNLQVET